MSIVTVIAPFYNETRFVKAWLACMQKFADEIITMDTGSDDGTDEYLQGNGVTVLTWNKKLGYEKWNKDANEWAVRESLRKKASGDWIVTFDMDELVGDEFIEFVRGLPESMKGRRIARFPWLTFWGDMQTLRMPSMWPPVTRLRNGKLRLLRNWRGQTGTYVARMFKNDKDICWNKVPEHTMIQDGRGRWCYRDRRTTLDVKIPIYHLHYAFPAKSEENRIDERDKQVKTKHYAGPWPEELELI